MVKKHKYKPCVVVVYGSPLRGKDYLAKKIKSVSNFEILELDRIRTLIDPNRCNGETPKLLTESEEFPIMAAVYAYFCSKAWYMVSSGESVLLPATFSRKEFKAPLVVLKDYLLKYKIPLRIFYLKKPGDNEIVKRLNKRKKEGSFSNITTLKQLRWAESFFEKIDFWPVVEVDTENSDCLKFILKNLNDLKLGK